MKRFALYIIILGSVLLLAGCRDNFELPEPTPEPRAEAERTVIVYMAGDNSLHLAVRADTIEMARGKNLIPQDVNFIIFVDDKQHDNQGKPIPPVIYELSAKNGMKLWKQYRKEMCSTDSLTMLQVLREIEYYFPARHYGITLASHASGWVPERMSSRRNTFGKDESPGTTTSGKIEMEIPVLRDVLAHFPKFDYIFFDACFMQCIEVAYELREVTNYVVGSPAEIPGPGAPYDKIIDALCKGDAKGIVQGYDSGYPGTYNNFYYPGVLLSCIDCSQLETLASETGRFLKPFYLEHTEPHTTGFQSYCDISWSKYTYNFDMRTTMCRLLSEEDYAAWMEVFDKAVPLYTISSSNAWFAIHCQNVIGQNAIVIAPECYGGVSMFVPMNKYDFNACSWNKDFQKTSWYVATGWADTGW